MKLVCESLQELFESPDEVALPDLRYNKDGEPVDFNEENPYVDSIDAHPFYLWKGEFILGKRGAVHPNGLRRAKAYPGRLWKDEKIMSFWEYPDKETFNKIIEQINQKLSDYYPNQEWDITNDPDWMIEVIPVEDLGRGTNMWKQNDEYTAKLVSLKNYEGSQERSETDLAKQHITSPLFKAKHVSQGFGSKDPAYQAKRAWQMASATSEGVADTYAARHFGIPDPEEEFNREYAIQKYGKPTIKAKNVPIYKNPKSLDGFDKGVRGVVDKEGNLYLAIAQEGLIHDNILDALKRSNLISSATRGWDDPEKFDQYDFVTVQRIWGKEKFAIGESYAIPKPKFPEEREKSLKIFEPFLVNAQKVNPQFEWILEQVRVVARKTLSPEEYEEFKTQGSGA